MGNIGGKQAQAEGGERSVRARGLALLVRLSIGRRGAASAVYRGVSAMIAVLAGAAAAAQDAEPTIPPTGPVTAETSAERFTDLTSESAARALVREALSGRHVGARAFFQGKQLTELRHGEIADLAKSRNLTIEIRRQNHLGSQAALTVAEANFDAVISASIRHTRARTYDRSEGVSRLREEVTDFEQLQRDFASSAVGQPPGESEKVCVVVDGELLNGNECQDDTRFSTETEFASFEIDPQYSWTGGIQLSKPFRFGGNFSIGFESKHNKKESYSFLDPLDLVISTDDPIGRDDRFPFSSFIGARFFTPLPYARNFGEFGSETVIGIKIVNLAAQKAELSIASEANDVQGQLAQAYWASVGALKQLQIAVAQRQALEEITASTRRQYDKQLITAYDMAQAEAELDNARNLEELSWSNFVTASNAVAELLNYDPDMVVLPVQYEGPFAEDFAIDADNARQLALEHRRELGIRRADIDSSEIVVKFRENQMRPELSLNASVRYSQSDAVIGYDSLHDSLLNLFNPDTDDYFIGVSYRLPFGKEAEKSALSQARIQNTEALDAHAQTELGITEEVNSALSGTLSARSQAELAGKNMDLAQLAYEKVERLKNLGLATQFELLRALNDVLSARLAYVAARVGYHQAYARLRTAQGLYE